MLNKPKFKVITVPSKINKFNGASPLYIDSKVPQFGNVYFNFHHCLNASYINKNVFRHAKHLFIVEKDKRKIITYDFLKKTFEKMLREYNNDYAMLDYQKNKIRKLILAMTAFAFQVISNPKHLLESS